MADSTRLPAQRSAVSVRVCTLGRFSVEVDGAPLRFETRGQRKPLELLKVLVACGGVNVPQERLAEALWPDAEGDAAQESLATTLRRLRGLIGAEAPILRARALTLNPDHCWVDAQAFAATAQRVTNARAVGHADEAGAAMEECLALYRGPFLDGEFEPGEILSARERLHALFLRQVRETAEFWQERGEPVRAIALYLRGLEADEVAEEFYRGLMRCYHAQGRLAEAMQAYRRCRDVLGATLDVKPSDETERIFRDVRGAAALAPDRLPTLAPAGWPASDSGPVRLVTRPWRRGLLLAVAVVVAVGAAAGAWQGYWIAGRSTAPGVVRERESTRPDQRPSIAVLAFENLSGDPEQEYFSDGMADSIITRLAGLQQLFVISRNSSFLFKGKAVGAREAGLKLGATYVLEGSVQKADGRVRINAQLIETATDKHVWAEQYDRELRDVFVVQDEITRRVVGELGQKFIWGEWNRTSIEATRNVQAYDLYLRARSLAYATERARSFRAIDLLERAIALDPEYARAMGLMGNIYVELARRGEIDRPDEAYRRAEQLATRALAIDPSDPSALVLMGHVLSQRGDHERAIALSRQALAVEPNNYSMQFRLAWQLWLDGQVDEALQLITQAMRVWPMPPPGFRQVEAWINLHAGNYETAERIFRTFADPKNEVNFINRQGQLGLILSLLHQDRVGEAREEAEKFRQFPDFPFRLFVASWRRTGLRDTQRLERHLALFRKVGLEE